MRAAPTEIAHAYAMPFVIRHARLLQRFVDLRTRHAQRSSTRTRLAALRKTAYDVDTPPRIAAVRVAAAAADCRR